MRALMRPPPPTLADGVVTFLEASDVEMSAAFEQWGQYRAALQSAGWDVTEVPIAADLPDSVFIEDVLVMCGTLAILTRPGSPHRAAEPVGVAPVVAQLGYEVVELASGRLDGGDILKVGDTWYVGQGGRSDAAGLEALRAIVADHGITCVPVPMTRALHLKSAVTALPDGSVIGYLPTVDDPSVFGGVVEMPEEPGAHVVDLGNSRLLMSAAAPRSADAISARGYEPVLVDITEFEKLEGCVTCLSVRIRD